MQNRKQYHPLIAAVKSAIRKHKLLNRELKLIVAVSGGADSVALLACLVELGYDCIAAHCNFHLRGQESMRDMRFVSDLAKRLGVDLHIRDFDVEARMKSTGESVEMACRNLRYDWFNDLLEKNHAQAIVVGHHQEDNVETFFLNLFRGTGIAGLTGMKYRNGLVVRPMLGCTRQMIESYLADNDLTFIIDSTNAQNDYKRNRIRNLLMPILEEVSPGAVNAVIRTMAYLQDNRNVYDQTIADARERYYDRTTGHLALAELIANEQFANVILYEIIKDFGFNMSQADDIVASAASSGLQFAAGHGIVAELDRGVLKISSSLVNTKTDEAVTVDMSNDILSPINIRISRHPVADFSPVRDEAVAYLDTKALEGNPRWALRRWHRGDRIKPYGMAGSKLVSDIFADAKYSAEQKRNAWLLTRDDEVIWIVGLRASRTFAVTKTTNEYIELSNK
jgi:tRNA(Ile)-lysidine synthase